MSVGLSFLKMFVLIAKPARMKMGPEMVGRKYYVNYLHYFSHQALKSIVLVLALRSSY